MPRKKTIDVQVRQLAASPEMRGADGKTVMELQSFHSEGNMRMDADEHSPCPHSGKLLLVNDVALKGVTGARPIKTTVTVTFGRK